MNAETGRDMPDDVLIERRVNSAIARGARLPRWGWSIPRSYNGATGEERVLGWQRLRFAENSGWLLRPSACTICETEKRLHLHTENYFRNMYVRAVCQQCHFCLHRRFIHPSRWMSLIVDAPSSADWARSIGLTELTRKKAILLSRKSCPWLEGNICNLTASG